MRVVRETEAVDIIMFCKVILTMTWLTSGKKGIW